MNKTNEKDKFYITQVNYVDDTKTLIRSVRVTSSILDPPKRTLTRNQLIAEMQNKTYFVLPDKSSKQYVIMSISLVEIEGQVYVKKLCPTKKPQDELLF